VFRLTTNGQLTSLVSFGYTNGSGPYYGGLTLGNDGDFYGTTASGGTNGGYGTVFRVTTNGQLTSLVSFGNYETPAAGLTLGKDGNFYGTTPGGGSYGGYGTVFRVRTDGQLTFLASFDDSTNGGTPTAGLTLAQDGNFYSTSSSGGTNGDRGTVFRVTPNGQLTSLVSFGNTNGGNPVAGLTLGSDGNFYGTTEGGGTNGGYGTVFRVTTNGQLTSLVSFDYTNGAYPEAGLTLRKDGYFYGTTRSGGTNGGYGTVFRLTTDGQLTSLVSFGIPNGVSPVAGLTLGSDGNFYGTTEGGGSSNLGTVFKLRLVMPPAILSQPPSRTNDAGTAATFSIVATGSPNLAYQWRKDGTNLTDVSEFSGTGGPILTVTNVQRTDAGRYDVIITNAYGSVTSIVATLTVVFPPNITSQPQSLTNGLGTSAAFAVTATGDVPLAYQWRKNGVAINGATTPSYTISSVIAADSGSYDVVVTNLDASATSQVATLTIVVPGLAWRTLPTTFQPGETVTVRLDVTPPAGTTNWSITDYYPGNWLFAGSTNPSSADDYSAQVVLGPFTDSQPRTLAYQVASVFESDNVGVFSGYLADSALATNAPVLGDSNTVAVRQWEFVGPQVLVGANFVSGAAYGAGRWVATSLGWLTTRTNAGKYWTYPKGQGQYTFNSSRMAFLGDKFLWWGGNYYTGTPLMAASDDGLSWKLARPEPGDPVPDPFRPGAGSTVESAAYGDGVYVAVGFHSYPSPSGTIWRSTNAYEWRQAYQLPALNTNLWSVAFGDGKFIAVGDFGTAVSSTDGLNWAPLDLGDSTLTNRTLQGIGYGTNGWLITVGGSSFKTLMSLDGINWSAKVPTSYSSPRSYYSFYADGKYWFTYVDDSYITVDGISWTNLAKTSVRRAPDGVKPRFLGGSTGSDQQGSPAIYGSEDATNWIMLVAAGPGWPNVQTVIAASGEWLASGIGCGFNGLYGWSPLDDVLTTNLWLPLLGSTVSWHAASDLRWITDSVGLIGDYTVYRGDIFAAGYSFSQEVVTLNAGPINLSDHSFQSRPLANPLIRNIPNKGASASRASLAQTPEGLDLYQDVDVTYSDGTQSRSCWGHYFSQDGTNWAFRAPGLNDVTQFPGIRGIAWGAGLYVAVSTGYSPGVPSSANRIYTSIDGNNYSALDLSALSPALGSEGLTGLAFGGGVFVCVGDQGRILCSTNGLSWQTSRPSNGVGWNRVRYLNGGWAVVGNAGRVAFSSNARDWIVKSTGVYNDLNDIASLNGYYMIVGNNGMVLHSTSVPLQILASSFVRQSTGAWQFTVQSDPFVVPVIQSSTDLIHWLDNTPTTNTPPDSSGLVTFTDLLPPDQSHRFYRARLP
jgi:uncharacterized repeat protein (TIGR03803 family)